MAKNAFDYLFEPEEAINLKIRADLMDLLRSLIEERFATQAEAAEALGVTRPRVSDLMRGQFNKFTIDALVKMLGRMNRHIGIRVEIAEKAELEMGSIRADKCSSSDVT